MEWTVQDLGAIGEFVASIAVVISLIYVGTQLRQNSKLARIQGTEERRGSWAEFGRSEETPNGT